MSMTSLLLYYIITSLERPAGVVAPSCCTSLLYYTDAFKYSVSVRIRHYYQTTRQRYLAQQAI